MQTKDLFGTHTHILSVVDWAFVVSICGLVCSQHGATNTFEIKATNDDLSLQKVYWSSHWSSLITFNDQVIDHGLSWNSKQTFLDLVRESYSTWL